MTMTMMMGGEGKGREESGGPRRCTGSAPRGLGKKDCVSCHGMQSLLVCHGCTEDVRAGAGSSYYVAARKRGLPHHTRSTQQSIPSFLPTLSTTFRAAWERPGLRRSECGTSPRCLDLSWGEGHSFENGLLGGTVLGILPSISTAGRGMGRVFLGCPPQLVGKDGQQRCDYRIRRVHLFPLWTLGFPLEDDVRQARVGLLAK